MDSSFVLTSFAVTFERPPGRRLPHSIGEIVNLPIPPIHLIPPAGEGETRLGVEARGGSSTGLQSRARCSLLFAPAINT